MKKALLLVLAAATLLASFGVAATASADVQEDGKGSLTAHGDGIAVLGGKGKVELTGNGILWVRDVAGDAMVEVTGYGEKKEFNDGWVQYAGFHGTAEIKGSRIIVMVAGVDIDLEAKGRGRCRLWGHGTYEMGDRSGEWSQVVPVSIDLMAAQ